MQQSIGCRRDVAGMRAWQMMTRRTGPIMHAWGLQISLDIRCAGWIVTRSALDSLNV